MMNASELKYQVNLAGHESQFFTPKTMRFFGDKMSNYGVRQAVIRTTYDENGNYVGDVGGREILCWELYRKRPVKHGLQASAYFARDTFRRLYPARDDIAVTA
jgi:hypothetical protein